TIANEKRLHVGATGAFASNILAEFISDAQYGGLRDLVEALHKTLFFNKKVSRLCRGSYVDEEALNELRDGEWSLDKFLDVNVGIDVSVDPLATDPFARRAKFVDTIVDDLMETFTKARDKA
ncbi:hypothetical protein IWQ57_005506, partial [Coemansia nantahalensis]